jgi:hypothetical protein
MPYKDAVTKNFLKKIPICSIAFVHAQPPDKVVIGLCVKAYLKEALKVLVKTSLKYVGYFFYFRRTSGTYIPRNFVLHNISLMFLTFFVGLDLSYNW